MMKAVRVVICLGMLAVFPRLALAQAPIGCAAQVPVNVLTSFSDYSPISTITPQTMRNFACSTPLAIPTISQLRTNTVTPASINVLGNTRAGDGGGAIYDYNPLDRTSPDNGSTIIVDSAGHRWYRSGPTTTFFAANVATMGALTGGAAVPGSVIILQGYRVAGDMPSASYTLSASACSLNLGAGDGGSQIPSVTGGCWLIAPQTIWDPHWWGAYGDVQQITAAITTIAHNAVVTIPGASFGSVDSGKLITITDYVDPETGNNPSYQGRIVAGSGSTVTVSPAPGFSTTPSGTDCTMTVCQVAYWGHDDAVPMNNAITYIQSLRVTTGGQQVPASVTAFNGGGNVYGVCAAPITIAADTEPENLRLVALCSANMSLTSGGLMVMTGGPAGSNSGGSYTGSNYVRLDAGYLPVNALYAGVNGNTHWNNVVMVNWMGHDAGQGAQVTGDGTSPIVTVSSTANLIDGMVSHGNTTACGGGAGIADRSVIVSIIGPTRIALNHVPTGTCTAASVTFYHDANGILEPPNAGLHANDFLQAQSENNLMLKPNANHYGFGLLYRGNQADMTKFITNGGVAPVYIGSTGAGLWILNESILFGGTYQDNENNAPAVLIGDGGGPTYIDDTGIVGNIQLFYITNTGNPSLRVTHINYGSSTTVTLSPNSVVNLYTAQAATPTFRLQFTGDDWDAGAIAAGAPSSVSYNTIGAGSWTGINATAAAAIANSGAYHSAGNTNGPFATQGADFLTGAVKGAQGCMIGKSASYTYVEEDSGCVTNMANSGPVTLTLPNTLAGGNGGGEWKQEINLSTFAAVTLAVGTGASLNGVANGTAALQPGVIYFVNCTSNSGGTHAACFITGPGVPLSGFGTVSELPTCNAAYKFAQTQVVDANSPALNTTVTGGGTGAAAEVPVHCNGSNWVYP